MILLKRTLRSIYLTTNTLSFVVFHVNVWCSFVPLSHSTVNPSHTTLYNIQSTLTAKCTIFSTFSSHSAFTYSVISTFSDPNSQYLPVSHIFMYTHGSIYTCLKVIKLYYRRAGKFYWYAKVTFVCWIVDLFFFLTFFLVFINE
jgi:hypothetical protein